MSWTGWKDARAEAWAEEMLQGLRQAMLERWGDLLAGILVIGGFGRGEGSVLRTREGLFKPWNDVDLLLVRQDTAREPSDWEVQTMAWAVERGLDSVDMSWVRPDEWMSGPETLYHVEVKQGHRVLWGSDEVVNPLPGMLSRAARAQEAHRMLSNRGYALLLWALNHEVENTPERLSFRLNVLVKCHMALGDARLLLADRLPLRYAERVDFLREVEAPDEVRRLHAEAVERKLRPTEDWALEPRDWSQELYDAVTRWLRFGPLALAGVDSASYPEYVVDRLGSWRRRLRYRLRGSDTQVLDLRSRLDASLPRLLEGLRAPTGWRPSALTRLWPEQIKPDTPWREAAGYLVNRWQDVK